MQDRAPILIISTRVDAATDVVVQELRARGHYVVRVDTDAYPYRVPIAIDPGSGRLVIHDVEFSPRAIWYRRVRSPDVPAGMDPGVHDYCVREAQTMVQGIGLAAGCPVMSDPGAVFAAENKIRQLVLAKAQGLQIPDTCVANHPEAVRAFASRHHRMVCKPLRSGWFQDAEGQWSIYTTEVHENLMQHLDEVVLSPSIFQPLIEKACDVRVTVVGGRYFVAEIDSQSELEARVDWRKTSNPDLPHRVGSLPGDVEARLRRLMDVLGLRFGAIDLVRTPDDDYVFLEVNPNGQWLWLDDQLGLGITSAVADWLGEEHE